ncbi:MAG: hypothetical protein M1457_14150 [bacterium]|nr:hypothetical protein [bacterium]
MRPTRKRPPISRRSDPLPGRGRRGGLLLGVVLVGFLLIIIVARVLWNQNRQETQAILLNAQSDPRDSLERFLLERRIPRQWRDDDWQVLLDFMSRDDVAWFERNYPRLAEQAFTMKVTAGGGKGDRQRRFAALEALLPFGRRAPDLVVSQVREQGDRAVAYVHAPRDAATMREVFLVREGGLWKIRRFLGRRDDPEILKPLVESKRAGGETLSEDESDWLRDPAGYAARRRAVLLAEAGLKSN